MSRTTAVNKVKARVRTVCFTLNPPSSQTLLPAASLLQLNGVRDACCKFLLSQLDPSNCLGIRGFADTHSCSDLLKSAHKYVLQHFVEVSKTEEFMLLPLKQVGVLTLLSCRSSNRVLSVGLWFGCFRWVKPCQCCTIPLL